MRLRDYIKDHIVDIILEIIALIMIAIFMSAFNVSRELSMAVSLILIILFGTIMLRGYFRKRRFYSGLMDNLRELDQKYLLAETLTEPQFYEGKIMYEIISELDKSMYENVAGARRYAVNFKEYIEMWVHEVKLPIASLLLSIKNISEKMEDSEEINALEARVRRINEFADQVLYYARSENSEKDYIFKEEKLSRIVSAVLSKYRPDIQERGVELKVSDIGRTVITDGKWLEFMLAQFISNSLRYTEGRPEPTISIFSDEKDGNVILHFRDNGIGIPEKDIGRIWEKAFTGENGRENSSFGSTGMGLYLVKKMCDKLGHKVACESVYGEYTDMMIIFGKNDIYKITG
ncbi:Signal transduction histidine kinase [Eubacterium ruminantium]|nr:Signal transduction histidine kinase [Eubacterium ruminantium]